MFTPVFSRSAVILNNLADLKDYFKTIDYYKNEKSRLETRIFHLESSVIEASGYEDKISRLEALLELKTEIQNMGKPSVCSNVVGRSGANIIINKGSDAGISLNDAVVSHKGIVGRVSDVSYNYSVIQTVADENFTVFARNLRSGDLCSLKGSSERLILSDADLVVREGDIFETSGGYDYFPGGVSIGKLTGVFEKNGVLFSEVIPFVNISELKEVLVIFNE